MVHYKSVENKTNTHSEVMVKRDMWDNDDLIFFSLFVLGHRVAEGHIFPVLKCMHPVLVLLCENTNKLNKCIHNQGF